MAKRILVIGIAGPAGAGKNTAAYMVQARTGGYLYAFADPIKRMLNAIGIDTSDEVKNEVIPLLDKSPRELMQTLGTEWGQHMVRPDIWTTMAQMTLLRRGPLMIVTDVRFPHEADWVRRMGGMMIHIKKRKRKGVPEHSSEAPLEVQDTDFVIDNSGSLEELNAKIGELFDG